jgi:hypothetical protein
VGSIYRAYTRRSKRISAKETAIFNNNFNSFFIVQPLFDIPEKPFYNIIDDILMQAIIN